MEFDYIIIGGGISGLTCATHLSKTSKVLLLEKSSVLGGCHSATFENNKLSEHSPRVYSTSYKNFNHLLNSELNIDTKKFFTKYRYQLSDLSFFINYPISFFILFIFYFINILFPLKNSVEYYTWFLNKKLLKKLDLICKLTDGVSISRYPFTQFLNLPNHNFLGQLLQPTEYMSTLFDNWELQLKKNNVVILKEIDIFEINEFKLKTNSGDFKFKKLIFACGLDSIEKLMGINLNSNLFKYDPYYSVVFHWKEKIKLPKETFLKETKDSLIYLITSDYINSPGTIISTTINSKGKNGMSITNSFNNLLEIFPNLNTNYTFTIPKINYTAYQTTKIPFEISKDIYCVGCYSGKSNYPFTTAESAVQNSLQLLKKINVNVHIKRNITLNNLLFIILILFYIK